MNPWDQFTGANAGYVYELFERYQRDPSSVDEATRRAFATWTPTDPVPATAEAVALQTPGSGAPDRSASRHRRVHPRRVDPPLRPSRGAARSARLSRSDRRSVAATASARPDHRRAEAAAGVDRVGARGARRGQCVRRHRRLRDIYCSTTGHDYNHVFVPDERVWLRQAVEARRFRPPTDPIDGRELLDRITQVETFERFLHRTFPGQDAILDRRPRHDGADPRRDRSRRRRGRRAARDDRDGASRPAQRARAHPAEAVHADPRGVQGSGPVEAAARRPGLDGRREVSRRRAGRGAAGRSAQAGRDLDAAEPEPPRSGGSGAERHGPRGGDAPPTSRARRSWTRARCWRS